MGEWVTDWTGRFTGRAQQVLRPKSTREVAETLVLARHDGCAVTTRGGNTGLVGGAVPASDRPTRLLDTTRLRRLDPVDADSGQVTVGAGITLGELQRHARAAGWEYGVDLAARDSATVGGTVATNAGGIRVVRYGMTRAQVVGVEAVLPDGEIIDDTAGLLKNNTGYSLSGLLTGSEGTLGVITAVRVALHTPPRTATLAVLPIESLAEGVALGGRVRRSGAELLAAETIDHPSRILLGSLDGPQLPRDVPVAPWYLFIEVADGGTADGVAALADQPAVVVALTPGERRQLWAVREGMTEAWGAAATQAGTVVQKFDVSLPSVALDAFTRDAVELLGDASAGVGMFGHLADGNLHLEVIDPVMEWDGPILSLVAGHGGSISAEHGIGRAKRDYLQLSRSSAEIAAMRAIKAALDPDWMMNPGILFTP